MLDHHTSDAAQPHEDHQTIIKFVLSGPILGGHDAPIAQVVAPSADVDELGERMTALERALADADARIDALSRALAATVSAAAATPGNWSSRRTERPAKAAQTVPQAAPPAQPVAVEPPAPEPVAPEPIAPEPVAPEPIATAPEPIVAVATAPEPIAAVAVAPRPAAVAPEPVYAMAGAATPALAPPALVAQPATRAPAPRSSHPTPPKVRALRRVISVLKHL